jgi:hypothetical protein
VTLHDVLPALSDIICGGFALWSSRALGRIITGRNVKTSDPMMVIALLLISGRYGFTLNRWAFGVHHEVIAEAEELGRQGAFFWSIATVAITVFVLHRYRKVI